MWGAEGSVPLNSESCPSLHWLECPNLEARARPALCSFTGYISVYVPKYSACLVQMRFLFALELSDKCCAAWRTGCTSRGMLRMIAFTKLP